MEVLYPSFLPKVPHNPTVDEDDEVWLRQREEEQHERREAMCKLENYPKPVGVKDVNEQSDTVELGEGEDEEDEEDEGEVDDELEEDSNEVSASDFMEESNSFTLTQASQSDLDMSVG